mgnify:CR=1 FL=1
MVVVVVVVVDDDDDVGSDGDSDSGDVVSRSISFYHLLTIFRLSSLS